MVRIGITSRPGHQNSRNHRMNAKALVFDAYGTLFDVRSVQ